MEDRFLPIREFQMRPNAIRVTDLAYIQGVSINFNQHFPSSKKLSLHKLSIKQLPIDGSVGYELRSSTNKCKQSNNIDQHTFLSEWSVVLPLVYLYLFQCSFSFFRVDNKPVNESCCATFLGHLVRSRPRDRIRNSIEIRVAFENRIRNRVASLAWREGGGVLLKASRLWEDSRIATYALSLRTRGSFCVPWSPPSLCTGYGNYGRKFGEFAERGKWGAGGGSKVPWLIALWGFVGQPFIMANLVFGHLSTGIQRLLIYTFLFITPEFAPDFIYQNLYRI